MEFASTNYCCAEASRGDMKVNCATRGDFVTDETRSVRLSYESLRTSGERVQRLKLKSTAIPSMRRAFRGAWLARGLQYVSDDST